MTDVLHERHDEAPRSTPAHARARSVAENFGHIHMALSCEHVTRRLGSVLSHLSLLDGAHSSADTSVCITPISGASAARAARGARLRLGVIGIDSSHGVGFAQNLASPGSLHKDAVVVACVRQGTGYKNRAPVIDSMHSNIAKHAEQMVKVGVSVVDTVAELLDQVDAVFLTSWDGRVSADPCC